MADAAGVDVGPVEVQPGLLIVPLLSWYNCAFDLQDPRWVCSWGEWEQSGKGCLTLKDRAVAAG